MESSPSVDSGSNADLLLCNRSAWVLDRALAAAGSSVLLLGHCASCSLMCVSAAVTALSVHSWPAATVLPLPLPLPLPLLVLVLVLVLVQAGLLSGLRRLCSSRVAARIRARASLLVRHRRAISCLRCAPRPWCLRVCA